MHTHARPILIGCLPSTSPPSLLCSQPLCAEPQNPSPSLIGCQRHWLWMWMRMLSFLFFFLPWLRDGLDSGSCSTLARHPASLFLQHGHNLLTARCSFLSLSPTRHYFHLFISSISHVLIPLRTLFPWPFKFSHPPFPQKNTVGQSCLWRSLTYHWCERTQGECRQLRFAAIFFFFFFFFDSL